MRETRLENTKNRIILTLEEDIAQDGKHIDQNDGKEECKQDRSDISGNYKAIYSLLKKENYYKKIHKEIKKGKLLPLPGKH